MFFLLSKHPVKDDILESEFEHFSSTLFAFTKELNKQKFMNTRNTINIVFILLFTI